MNHLLIITALQSEAEPIIKQYQLEKKHHSEKLFYFQRERITCLTTGVGEKMSVNGWVLLFKNWLAQIQFLLILALPEGKRILRKLEQCI